MLSKRKRFIITSLLLSLGFVVIQIIDNQYRFLGIGALSILTLGLFIWSLWEGLGFNKTLLSLILPVYFTLGVGLFWFLLPVSVLTRIPVLIFYAVGIYALCLTSNIYTVASIRSIALLRAARGVGFILTLVASFLIYDAILSVKLQFYFTFLLTFIVSIPIYYQGIWPVILGEKFSFDDIYISIIFSLITSQVYLSLFFWPVTVVVGSLFLTIVVYLLLGLGQAKLEGRLFSQTVREYLLIGITVFVGMLFATRWSG